MFVPYIYKYILGGNSKFIEYMYNVAGCLTRVSWERMTFHDGSMDLAGSSVA